jgi:alanyl-tRNA synthetase
MMSTSPARIAYTIFDGRGARTHHYENLEAMLADLLMCSGDEIPYLVRDKLLPRAIAAWDRSKMQDNCVHKVVDGLCSNCGADFGESA